MVSSQLPEMTAQSRGPAPQFSILAFRLRDPEQLSTHATASVLPVSPTAMDTSQSTDGPTSAAKRRKITHQDAQSFVAAYEARSSAQQATLALRPRIAGQPTAHCLSSGIELQDAGPVPSPQPTSSMQGIKRKRELGTIPRSYQPFKILKSELQLRVMSYLSLKDIRDLQQTCRDFSSIINASEDTLARPIIAYHLDRLQTSINEINAARMPTDATTLLASMRLWTSIRGSFVEAVPSKESWYKWFSHLADGAFRDPMHPVSPRAFEQWAQVAHVATSLQRQAYYTTRGSGKSQDLWKWFMSRCACYPFSPMDERGLLELYTRIYIEKSADRDISGPWHPAKKEYRIFPRPGNGGHRLTKIRSNVGEGPDTTICHSSPYRKSLLNTMLGSLGLPTLPPHDTFCYYATTEKLFDKAREIHSSTEVMHPLMRAKLLEWIKVF